MTTKLRLFASWLRKRRLRLTHRRATVVFREPVYLARGFMLEISPGGTFIAGPRVHFKPDVRVEVAGDGRVEIGADTTIGYGCVIQCSTSIELGERCLIAPSVMLVDGSHRFRDPTKPVAAQGYDFRPLRIEDDVVVSANCTVVGSIGRHAFIGANAVVTKDVPPYSLAVGVPARVVETFGPADHEPASSA
jgi:acetyltransferase-like isoleucine patch superfamily enzyme